MRKWQQGMERYAPVKYSDINSMEKSTGLQARWAMACLLKNGYGALDGYAVNEIMNMLKSLRELKVEYSMRVIQNYGGNFNQETGKHPTFHYEFYLPWFVDDRDIQAANPMIDASKIYTGTITAATMSSGSITTSHINNGSI